MSNILQSSANVTHEFNGIKISQRIADGYLDATAMCKATGKLFADYHRLKTTQEFLEALSLNMGTADDWAH
jgi:hypothetical protein